MQENREPTLQEKKLLDILIKDASKKIPSNWMEGLLVCSMQDDGMGSLYLYPNGTIDNNQSFGEQVSEYEFTDNDGVKVIASLYLDTNGDLFELDVWKTDFTPLIQFPHL